MDLGGWLRSLGLGQYEAAFRENAIDLSILPDLTDQDLEKIGVVLGHRRKLLRAVAQPRNPRGPRRAPLPLRQRPMRHLVTQPNAAKLQ